jgi:hypothetical protein
MVGVDPVLSIHGCLLLLQERLEASVVEPHWCSCVELHWDHTLGGNHFQKQCLDVRSLPIHEVTTRVGQLVASDQLT